MFYVINCFSLSFYEMNECANNVLGKAKMVLNRNEVNRLVQLNQAVQGYVNEEDKIAQIENVISELRSTIEGIFIRGFVKNQEM